MTRKVEVVPPPPAVIERFAHQAYWELGVSAPEREREFAGFLKVVARALAKALTRGAAGAFDTGIEQVYSECVGTGE